MEQIANDNSSSNNDVLINMEYQSQDAIDEELMQIQLAIEEN